MTFAEYNTDENFNKPSNAMELVRLGKEEGKTREEIANSLSPLWKEDKKGNIKKALDYHFAETPKEEPKAEETKPVEEKVTEKVIDNTSPTVDEQTEDFMNKNNSISYAQEDAENKRQSDELSKRWDARLANIDKMSQSMKNIDDHMVEQLPTFFFRRYQNGEFGDISDTSTPEGKESKKNAQLRLAHFLLNGVQSKLKNASNAFMVAAGKSPIFSDTTSDYEKYQQTNFAQGMENRWNKYKQETQSAIDLAKQGGMSEEAITDSIATISSNNRLQSAFNQMNERQKVFALQVLGEIGDKMGNMNDTQFVNTLMGMSAMGQDLDYKEAAAMLIYRTVKDPEKRNSILSSLGFDGGGLLGGIGGALGGNNSNENSDEPTTGTTLEDGTKIDPGKYMSSKEYKELVAAGDKLSQQYYNGEIDEAKFRSEYAKLEKIMGEHGWFSFFRNKGIKSADDLIRINNNENLTKLDTELKDLNALAKKGNIKPSEYEEKFANIRDRASKWGANEKYLKSIDKGKVKTETIIKASEKNAKKK